MRVAIYARFSSDQQNPRSIADQVALARSYADAKGMTIIEVYEDAGISGRSMFNRPGLLRLIRDAEAGCFDVVLTESLDRLSRSQADTPALYEKLAFHGVHIETLADGGVVSEMHVGLKGTMSALFLKDLAQKTRRGQIGRVKAGRIPGGRCFGYDVVKQGDDRGLRTINQEQAAIVRRIFTEYVQGRSPIKIVQALNAEGIPAPRGAHWNASTLLGSAKRRNGILNNSLYRGQITYDRQRFVKDPATGRRQSRSNPQNQWHIKDVPELAIVSTQLFEAAQTRRSAHARKPLHYHRRPKQLLSGLLVCGVCGSNMIVKNSVRGIVYFGCSARTNRAGCDNARSVSNRELEARVLAALKKHLMDADIVAAAIEAYRSERQRLSREHAKERSSMARQLSEVNRKIAWLIREIEDGRGSKNVSQRLRDLELEQGTFEARLASTRGADLVELHPQAAVRYRQKVEEIQAALACGDATGIEAVATVRELITRIRIIPAPRGKPVGLEISGDLAALLNVNEGGTPLVSSVVAGARNHLDLQLMQLLSASIA